MYPINDLRGIEQQEQQIEGQHVVILLFVKPSDNNADEILNKLNYWHHLSGDYCSIYMVGYSLGFCGQYKDVETVKGIDNQEWEYSDTCFIDVCRALKKRLKHWQYSGEPEMIILRNNMSPRAKNPLDFRCYNYIDINYGIENKYIDTFPRFMERFIEACESEVTAQDAVRSAYFRKYNVRRIMEKTIDNAKRIPKPVKQIMKDALFFKTYKSISLRESA